MARLCPQIAARCSAVLPCDEWGTDWKEGARLRKHVWLSLLLLTLPGNQRPEARCAWLAWNTARADSSRQHCPIAVAV